VNLPPVLPLILPWAMPGLCHVAPEVKLWVPIGMTLSVFGGGVAEPFVEP